MIVAVISVLMGLSLVAMVLAFARGDSFRSSQAVVRILLNAVLCIFLYRGARWARWFYVVTGLIGGWLVLRFAWPHLGESPAVYWLLLTAGLMFAVSFILLFWPSVRLHFSPAARHVQE